MSPGDENSTLMSRIVGVGFFVVGVGFLGLLLRLKIGGELAGDIRISAAFLGISALMLWLGTLYLRPEKDRQAAEHGDRKYDPFLRSLRRPVEGLALAGFAAMLYNAIALSAELAPIPRGFLTGLILAPVALWIYIDRVSVPRAFPRPYRESVTLLWSPQKRFLGDLILQLGGFGYLGALAYWYGLERRLSGRWGSIAGILASLLIAAMYASQALVLHFGRLRERVRNV